MAIIDILTHYDAKKKAAHAAKTVKHGVSGKKGATYFYWIKKKEIFLWFLLFSVSSFVFFHFCSIILEMLKYRINTCVVLSENPFSYFKIIFEFIIELQIEISVQHYQVFTEWEQKTIFLQI